MPCLHVIARAGSSRSSWTLMNKGNERWGHGLIHPDAREESLARDGQMPVLDLCRTAFHLNMCPLTATPLLFSAAGAALSLGISVVQRSFVSGLIRRN